MKTTALNWTAVCLSVLATGTIRVPADQAVTTTRNEKTSTGTVVAVDPRGHLLEVKGLLLNKKFNLGDSCTYTFEGKGGTAADLHPGQKVMVSYQDADGVLVADRISQTAMCSEGTVKAIDADKHTLILHQGMLDKTFHIADACNVVLFENKSGTLADVQPGERVTVVYETSKGPATACEIRQTSATFSGALTAFDLSERTLKAKSTFDTKAFHLGNGCAIVLNGKATGQLSNLKPGDKLTVSYNEINGINVANRIAEGGVSSETMTAQSGK